MMKSVSPKNLRLHQPDGGASTDDAIPESAWSDADLAGLESWLLSDGAGAQVGPRGADEFGRIIVALCFE